MTNAPNPYSPPNAAQAPYREPEQVPQNQPSTAIPKVFGILSIIFASMVLLFGLLGSCMGFAFRSLGNLGSSLPQSGQAGEQARIMMEYMGTIYFYIGIQSLAFAAMSAWLLTIGIGQLRYRRWARNHTIYWSIAAFVVLVAVVVFSFAFIGPAYQRMFEAMAKSAPSGALPSAFTGTMSGLVGGSTGITMLIFYAPYPILLLIYFTRPRVIAAMNQ
jgi:hypothetical protein